MIVEETYTGKGSVHIFAVIFIGDTPDMRKND